MGGDSVTIGHITCGKGNRTIGRRVDSCISRNLTGCVLEPASAMSDRIQILDGAGITRAGLNQAVSRVFPYHATIQRIILAPDCFFDAKSRLLFAYDCAS